MLNNHVVSLAVLNILRRLDHRKLPLIFFYYNMEKIRKELALVSVEKARAFHLPPF